LRATVALRRRALPREVAREFAQGVEHQPAGTGFQLARDRRRHHGFDLGRVAIQHSRQVVHGGDTVGEQVMHLVDVRDAPPFQALDDPDLPQRPRPVQLPGGDLADYLVELLLRARPRHRDAVQVHLGLEAAVVDDHRVVQAERHRHDAVLEQFQRAHRTLDQAPEALRVRPHLRRPAHQDLQRVHQRRRRFLVQEVGVLAAQSVHGWPPVCRRARR